jgi:uncharacterized protein GlcG (DUF336 family)
MNMRDKMNRIASYAAALALLAGIASLWAQPGAAQTTDEAAATDDEAAPPEEATPDAASDGCPVSFSDLRSALKKAVADDSSGFNNDMWAVVVDRDGHVCAVAFSGSDFEDQWLLSRQIAAAKAFTANGLSLDIDGTGSGALSTAQLYPLVQPGGSLFGLAAGNPLDPTEAYEGSASQFGTENDPLVGERVGGTITFGGGLGLYQSGNNAVGGLGLSGDTACADHSIAWRIRNQLKLVPTGQGDKIDLRRGGHARCPNDAKTQGAVR